MTRPATDHSPPVEMVAADTCHALESDKPPFTCYIGHYRSPIETSLTTRCANRSLDAGAEESHASRPALERVVHPVQARRGHACVPSGGCRRISQDRRSNLKRCGLALWRPGSSNADLEQLSGQVGDVAERGCEFGYARVRLLELGSGHEQIGFHISPRLDRLVQRLLGAHGPRMQRSQQINQLRWIGQDPAIDDEDLLLGSLKECGPRAVHGRLRHALGHRVFGQQMTGVHGWHGTADRPQNLVAPQWCRSTIDSSMARISWGETSPALQRRIIAGQTLVSHASMVRLSGLYSPILDGQTESVPGLGLMFVTATHPSETGSGTLHAIGRRYMLPAAGLAPPPRETNQMRGGEMRRAAARRHNNPDQVDHPQVGQTGGRQAFGKAKTARPEFLAEQGYMRFH